MHLIYPNIVRMVSIKFMKFIAPDPIFSLFSPLDTGFFVVIATALHSWGPWIVNWDRGLSAGEIVYKKVYKSGKAPCRCNKTWCPGPRGFSWNFSAFEHVWGYCTCTINFINSTSKKNSLLMLFEVNTCLSFQDILLFLQRKKLNWENCSSQPQHFGHTFGHFCSLDPWFPRPFLLNQGADKKEFEYLSCPI